jgi:hypothetical protein
MPFQRPLILLFCLLVAPVALAQVSTPPPAPPTQSADCQLCSEGASGFELAVPLWLPFVGIEGEATQGDGSKQNIAFDTQLHFAIVAEFRLRLGPVGLGLSANGASLGAHAVHSETGEDLGQIDLAAYFGRATLNWYTRPLEFTSGTRTAMFAIWPYIGARYALLSGQASNAEAALMFDGKTTWGEPLFGIESLLDLRRGWVFRLQADVGGFGLGSEISVWGAIEARYALANWLNFRMGWTAYYVRLAQGETQGELLLQGPAVGLGIPLF